MHQREPGPDKGSLHFVLQKENEKAQQPRVDEQLSRVSPEGAGHPTASFRGRRSRNPESITTTRAGRVMDSGFGAARRPGTTQ